jgi:hypothetical protein
MPTPEDNQNADRYVKLRTAMLEHLAGRQRLTPEIRDQTARDLQEYRALAFSGACTCGSGAHPRFCWKHPREYDRHVARLQAELATEKATCKHFVTAVKGSLEYCLDCGADLSPAAPLLNQPANDPAGGEGPAAGPTPEGPA